MATVNTVTNGYGLHKNTGGQSINTVITKFISTAEAGLALYKIILRTTIAPKIQDILQLVDPAKCNRSVRE